MRLTDVQPTVRAALDAAGVAYEVLVHDVTYHSAEEGAASLNVGLAQMAPTLVLHTEKGPLAAIISGATRLSLKKIKKALGLKNVALAAHDEVIRVTGAEPGTVALVNPDVPTIVDVRVLGEPWAYGGGGAPACTLKLRPADLVAVTRATVLDIAEEKPS